MSREIPLTQGYSAIVDDGDYSWLLQWKWFVKRASRTCYAYRGIMTGGKTQTVYMHRQILGAETGQFVDHSNHDGLDNRRSNIRICTMSQNAMNSRRQSKCGYRGVHQPHHRVRWSARMWIDGRQTHLGVADTPAEAARIYDAAARRHHGEFAVLNFPDEP